MLFINTVYPLGIKILGKDFSNFFVRQGGVGYNNYNIGLVLLTQSFDKNRDN